MHELVLQKDKLPSLLDCNYLVSHVPFKHVERTASFNVLILVTKGVLYVTEDGIDYEVGPGELLFLKSGVHCYGRKNMKPGLSWYYVHFLLPECKAQESNAPCTGSRLVLPKKTANLLHSEIEERLKALVDDFQRKNVRAPFTSNAALYLLLSELAFYAKRISSSNALLAEKLEHFLREHSCEPFSVASLEKEFNLTGKHLEYVFKKEKHCSLGAYHTEIRMAEACALLRTTLLSVKEISNKLGYGDMLYFSRMFHKTYGVSPSEYRRQIAESY